MMAGNCIPSGTTVTLSRQSEVDSFPINYPGCDVVDGWLIVSGSNITNIDSLINIKRINYRISFYDNNKLRSLKGLDSLSFCFNIDINNSDSLINLIGLNNLDSTYDLSITNNDMLINLIGLNDLKYASSLSITGNDRIINLKGLNSIHEIFGLMIYGNNELINLDGLQSLSVLDFFNISFNNKLINFIGLDNITVTNQHANITGNSSLTNFQGLHNWKTMTSGLLVITNNNSLVNLSGLNNLKSVGGIEIRYNNNLKSLEGIGNINTMSTIISGNLIYISDNPRLCSINDLNDNLVTNNLVLYMFSNPKLSCCKKVSSILDKAIGVRYYSVEVYNNAQGCNDTLEIRTTNNQNCCSTKYTFLKDTICEGESVVFDNQNLTNSGIYYDTLVSNGNDSIIILELKVYNKSYQIINKTLCIGQSFTLSNGRIITSNGTYKDTIPNFCDSIIEYRLSFLNNITVNQNASVCRGKTYTLSKGAIVNTSGIYRDTLRASFGCDSIVVTNLTVTNPVPFTNNVTICRGKTFTRPNGNIVSTSGIYYDTIKAPNTCDSIVITNLTVAPYLQSSETVSTCLGKSFVLPGGRSANQSGTYRDTIRNGNGCDSIIITNLTITNPIPFTNPVSICEGQSYTLPNGNKVNTSGIYRDTIRKPNTCDSIVITNLNVFPNNFTVSLNAMDTIESGSTITLLPIYTSGTAANWNWTSATNLSCSTCENPVASPAQTTLYVVSVKASDGCEDTAQTKIVVKQTNVYVPQAFSPNNDGLNDFAVVFANNPKSFSMKIYNRWGELVFESNNVNNQWDGTYKGVDCPQDNYTYILDVTMQNDKSYHKQSSITLLR